MPISFACDCGKQLKVADQFAGKRARCPACNGVVNVPEAPPPSPEDAAFGLLSQPDEEPAPPAKASRPEPAPEPPPVLARRAVKRDDEDDNTPYRMEGGYEPKPAKSDRDRPSFRGRETARREERERERSGITLSGGVLGGAGLMLLAAVWFIVGLAADRIFFYPPIMFIGGLVAVVKGLLGHSED